MMGIQADSEKSDKSAKVWIKCLKNLQEGALGFDWFKSKLTGLKQSYI